MTVWGVVDVVGALKVPFPSWPNEFDPQQRAPPSASNTHAMDRPRSKSVAPANVAI
jgi:hypothetical protein